jgi:formylmethanofuran dehydrogenase subunit E
MYKNQEKPKVVCDKCGSTISKSYLKQHQKKDICIRKSVCMILDD